MLATEKCFPFDEVVERLPRFGGRSIHPSTLWRWARHGVRGHRLETRRLGARLVTSLEAIDRFTLVLAELGPHPKAGEQGLGG